MSPVVDSGGSTQFCWNYLVLIVRLVGNGKSVVPLCNFRVLGNNLGVITPVNHPEMRVHKPLAWRQ